MDSDEHQKIMASNVHNYGIPTQVVFQRWHGSFKRINECEPPILTIPYGKVRSPKKYVLVVNDILRWVERGFFEHQDWRNTLESKISREEFIKLLDAQIERESLLITNNLEGAVASRKDYAMRANRNLLSKTEPGEPWVEIMKQSLTDDSPGTGTYVFQEVLGRYGEFGEEHRFSVSSTAPQLFWASSGEPSSELGLSKIVTKRLNQRYMAFEVPQNYLDEYGQFSELYDEREICLE